MDETVPLTASRTEPPIFAMIGGRVAQIPLVTAILVIIYMCNLVTGILLFTNFYDNTELISIISTVCGVLGVLQSIILYYAPFNLIKILNSTIDELVVNNKTYSDLNEIHQKNITSLKSNNEQLESSISDFQVKINKMQKVEVGLKNTSQNLLKVLSETSSNNIAADKITKSLALVAEDIDNNFQENMSSFMQNLLSMDELEDKLADSLDQNQALNHQLEATLQGLRKLVNGQQQTQFNSRMTDLARWIDSKADGNDGIRNSLTMNNLSLEQATALSHFLSQLDELIRLHDQSIKSTSEICSRHLNFRVNIF
jgi:hypothetical protein